MRATKIGIIMLAAAGLVIAGCSSGDGTTTPTAGSSSTSDDSPTEEETDDGSGGGGQASGDLVSWAANICEAVGPFEERFAELQTLPAPTDPSDMTAYTERVLETFGSMGDLFEAARAAIEDSGPPPVDGGDEMYDSLLAAFESAGEAFDEISDEIAGIDPADPAALEQLGAVFEEFTPELEEATETLDSTFGQAEMEAAFDAAPECEGITGS
jgi:hypothetical protein